MSNLTTFVKRTVHVQLQRLATPLPFWAALVSSELLIVGRHSRASVSAFTATLRKALTKSTASEGVASLFSTFTHILNTACLRVRIRVQIPTWCHMFNHAHVEPRHGHDGTYTTPRAETQYWRVAGRYHRRLYSGNSTTCTPSAPMSFTASRENSPGITDIPLVAYYTPRLLPLYRDHPGKHMRASHDADADVYWISPRTFCKWHRMVFPESCPPTLAQAAVQIKYHSNSDLREMQRIARLVPDEQVFDPKARGARRMKRRYSDMWHHWLESKALDLVIVFE